MVPKGLGPFDVVCLLVGCRTYNEYFIHEQFNSFNVLESITCFGFYKFGTLKLLDKKYLLKIVNKLKSESLLFTAYPDQSKMRKISLR